ncbi:MAG: hypothetical protein CM1200mP2_10800 [Planctomycetaceae bacterium]|nr:MAG: hypothetical protein CM1200mP2_10800 [Planctomycetaceae bacterium]
MSTGSFIVVSIGGTLGRPVIGFEEQSGEIEDDPDVQQQADQRCRPGAPAASGIVELSSGKDQLKLDHPVVVDTGNPPGVPVRLPVLPGLLVPSPHTSGNSASGGSTMAGSIETVSGTASRATSESVEEMYESWSIGRFRS